ncbi:DUF6090 family protein [Tamlana flava]|uniref:DUF6090 family protein n=1 Tax=Tamlana flava TaxID=3158572 RepID=UPI00351B7D4E
MLSEGKTGKYFKYAFGEIILVVIGILIALKVNNLNEQRTEEKQREVYTKSLITSLKQDSLEIEQFLKKSSERLPKLLEQFQRVKRIKATPDTLVKIARKEFIQTTHVFTRTYNNTTFKTLVGTGNIALFDSELVADLMSLNSMQESVNSTILKYNQDYIERIKTYSNKYPIYAEIPKIESPVHKLLWEDIKKNEFSSVFMSVITFKVLLENTGKESHELLLKKTIDLLKKLNKKTKS